jgi:hypothetical protein
MPKKLTQERFLERGEVIHNNKYNYSKVRYSTSDKKIIIICPEHGEFLQVANSHLRGVGCKQCALRRDSETKTFTKEIFLKRVKTIWGNQYDYSKVSYINFSTKVEIICFTHGGFFQSPKQHALGHGCPNCAQLIRNDKNRSSKEEFIIKAKQVHKNKYSYDEVVYRNNLTKVKVICKEHGPFYPKPLNHVSNKTGCPKCKQSKGELKISEVLNELNIHYISEHTFKKCKDKRCLKFDFYLPNHNICIEFDGEQHYKAISFFGGVTSQEALKKRDKIKNEFCKQNNINLIRIPYYELNNIKQTLSILTT